MVELTAVVEHDAHVVDLDIINEPLAVYSMHHVIDRNRLVFGRRKNSRVYLSIAPINTLLIVENFHAFGMTIDDIGVGARNQSSKDLHKFPLLGHASLVPIGTKGSSGELLGVEMRYNNLLGFSQAFLAMRWSLIGWILERGECFSHTRSLSE